MSLAVRENVVEEETGGDEGGKVEKAVDEGLQVRLRRRLKKAISIPMPETKDSEETESDESVWKLTADSDVNKEEQTRKRRQKQSAKIGPSVKKAKTDKGKVPLVEEQIEPTKEPDVAGSLTTEEMNHQIDYLLARPFISETLNDRVQEEQLVDEEEEKAEEEVVVMDEEGDEEEEERDEDSSSSERRRRKGPYLPQKD
ncbi:hypothetical protein Dimus_017937 [Dionaea muscipula]